MSVRRSCTLQEGKLRSLGRSCLVKQSETEDVTMDHWEHAPNRVGS